MAKKGPNQELKLQVYMRDGFVCAYCVRTMTHFNQVTVDHVLPKSKGGKDTVDNLTACCRSCNVKKGNLLLTQFLRAFEMNITQRLARFL